jgi:hypothetical protein
MEKELDFDRHFYLYAKGHYKVSTFAMVDGKQRVSDIMTDLKTITAKRCGIPLECLNTSDVLEVLIIVCYPHISKFNEYTFREFLLDLSPENTWKVGGTVDEHIYVKMCRKLKSILALTRVVDIPFELGEPDPDVLPLKEKA